MRRTNEERTSQTRARILEATVTCLIRHGYAKTSTTMISEQAGVSRGAQLHHFPNKAELMSAAIEHVIVCRTEEVKAHFVSMRASDEPVSTFIDILWEQLQTGVFYAWLELVVAARSDELLREKLLEVSRRFDQDVTNTIQQAFGLSHEVAQIIRMAGQVIFATVEGLSTSKIIYQDSRNDAEILNLLKATVKHSLIPYFQQGVQI